MTITFPESYLRKLYGDYHWLFEHEEASDDLRLFIEEEL